MREKKEVWQEEGRRKGEERRRQELGWEGKVTEEIGQGKEQVAQDNMKGSS